MTWDLLVVGGGPAGSMAALARLAAQPNSRVLIIDKAQFPREKACGDAIAAPAVQLLQSLGVDPDSILDGARVTRNLELRGPNLTVVRRELNSPTFVLRRSVLDERLLNAALAAGAEFEQGRIKSIEREPDAVVVGKHRAKVLVGADGSESSVRRLVIGGASSRPRMAVAIRGYQPGPPKLEDTHIIAMTGKAWPSYAWSFPAPDGMVNVGYGELLSESRPVTRSWLQSELLRLLPELAGETLDWRAARLALASKRPTIREGRTLLAGDALALVNPLTGEGIYHAMISGTLAGLASMSHHGAGDSYRALLAQKVGRHFRDLSLLGYLEDSDRLLAMILRRAQISQKVFDGLVDLGLHNGTITARWLAQLLLAKP